MSQTQQAKHTESGSLLEATVLTCALLLSPVVVFLRFHGYRSLLFEALLIMGGGVIVLAGMAAIRARPLARVFVLAVLTTAFVDLGFDLQTPVAGIELAGVFVASFVLLRRYEAVTTRLGAVIGTTVLGSSLLMPADTVVFDVGKEPGRTPTGAPLLVHIVLDEHLGIEALRSQTGDSTIASDTRVFLEQAGFRVFGGAYSEDMWTQRSLGRVFNFEDPRAEDVLETTGLFEYEMARNRYFSWLVQTGYTLRVNQTTFINLCPPTLSAECRTYDFRRLNTPEFRALPFGVRLKLMRFLFTNQSALRGNGDPVATATALSAMHMVNELAAQLRTATAGEAYFAHVMLPHFPYTYDGKCVARPLSEWLVRADSAAPDGLMNTEEGRRRRYDFYVDQMRCVHTRLEAALNAIPREVARRAIVIVHGDHGSRIVRRQPGDERATPSDFIDSFSTLFAVRVPGLSAGYQSDQISIACLFHALAEAGFQGFPELSRCSPARPVFSSAEAAVGNMPRFVN